MLNNVKKENNIDTTFKQFRAASQHSPPSLSLTLVLIKSTFGKRSSQLSRASYTLISSLPRQFREPVNVLDQSSPRNSLSLHHSSAKINEKDRENGKACNANKEAEEYRRANEKNIERKSGESGVAANNHKKVTIYLYGKREKERKLNLSSCCSFFSIFSFLFLLLMLVFVLQRASSKVKRTIIQDGKSVSP